MVSLPGQALAAQTLSIKGREERVKEMGVMSSSVHSPGDHVEKSLPLPREDWKFGRCGWLNEDYECLEVWETQ